MAESVYKVIELVGTSEESWEKAAGAAVARAGQSLRDLRIAEVSELDLQIENGQVKAYRAKVKVSFQVRGRRLRKRVGLPGGRAAGRASVRSSQTRSAAAAFQVCLSAGFRQKTASSP